MTLVITHVEDAVLYAAMKGTMLQLVIMLDVAEYAIVMNMTRVIALTESINN